MTDDNCDFCKMAEGVTLPPALCVNERLQMVLDLGPVFRGQALILPKQHFTDVCALDEESAAMVLPLGAKIGAATKKSLRRAGSYLVQDNRETEGWNPGQMPPKELTDTAEKINSGF